VCCKRNVDQTEVCIIDSNFQSRIFFFTKRFGSELLATQLDELPDSNQLISSYLAGVTFSVKADASKK
jgi:hypothetical protein